MSLHLDDLLPPNDAAYTPPADLRELFAYGSPLFEMADVQKFANDGFSTEQWKAFEDGYEAAMFEVMLKSGMPFFATPRERNVRRLIQRAEDFRRGSEIKDGCLTVEGHSE